MDPLVPVLEVDELTSLLSNVTLPLVLVAESVLVVPVEGRNGFTLAIIFYSAGAADGQPTYR